VADVVAGVPGIEEQKMVKRHAAALGVGYPALPVLDGEGLEEHDPAGVNAFDELERPLGGGVGVGQLGEGFFVVALDDGPVFGEGFPYAVEGGGVRVGNVMHDLADGPAAVAIGRVDLAGVEVADGFAEELGEFGERLDGVAAVFWGNGLRQREGAYGIAEVRVAKLGEFRHGRALGWGGGVRGLGWIVEDGRGVEGKR